MTRSQHRSDNRRCNVVGKITSYDTLTWMGVLEQSLQVHIQDVTANDFEIRRGIASPLKFCCQTEIDLDGHDLAGSPHQVARKRPTTGPDLDHRVASRYRCGRNPLQHKLIREKVLAKLRASRHDAEFSCPWGEHEERRSGSRTLR